MHEKFITNFLLLHRTNLKINIFSTQGGSQKALKYFILNNTTDKNFKWGT